MVKVVSIEDLTRQIKNLYARKNDLVHKINDVKLDIEVLEIIRETEIKKHRGK